MAVKFSSQLDAQRISTVVQKSERTVQRGNAGQKRKPDPPRKFLAKLTDEDPDNPGFYSWKAKWIKGDGALVDPVAAVPWEDVNFTAMELNRQTGLLNLAIEVDTDETPGTSPETAYYVEMTFVGYGAAVGTNPTPLFIFNSGVASTLPIVMLTGIGSGVGYYAAKVVVWHELFDDTVDAVLSDLVNLTKTNAGPTIKVLNRREIDSTDLPMLSTSGKPILFAATPTTLKTEGTHPDYLWTMDAIPNCT